MKIARKIKRSLENMTLDTQLYLVSLIVVILLSIIFVSGPFWQWIIIGTIIAGALNRTMKKGALSGAIGVLIVWFFYMIYAIMTRNAYANLDQFTAFIIGDLGYGWLLFILILLLGALIGALGGMIGSGIAILVRKDYYDDNSYTDKKQILELNAKN